MLVVALASAAASQVAASDQNQTSRPVELVVESGEPSSSGVVGVREVGRPSTEERSDLSQPALDRAEAGRRYRDSLVAILFVLAADKLVLCEDLDGIAEIVVVACEPGCQ